MTTAYDARVRIGPEALAVLDWMCARYELSVREVVEGLLLGTLTPPPANHGHLPNPNPFGLSPDEISTAQALGISVPTPRNTRHGGITQ